MAREPGLGDRLKGKEETEVWGATWAPACVSVRLGDEGRGGGDQNTVHPRNKSSAFPPGARPAQRRSSASAAEGGSVIRGRLNGKHGLGIKHAQVEILISQRARETRFKLHPLDMSH